MTDSKSVGSDTVRVRPPPSAPEIQALLLGFFYYLTGVKDMIDVNIWINNFVKKMNDLFGERIIFIGLQGSYSRNEATDTSDIDMVVILDELSVSDIENYNSLLNTLPYRKFICGFISGKNEILNWEPSDLIHFYYDTKPLQGKLDNLLNFINDEVIDRAIKTGVCNIYHACVHNMLYDKSDDIVKELYKSAVFVIQTICFKKTGKYILKHKDLIDFIADDEKIIVETFLELKHGGTVVFRDMSEILFNWSKKNII